MPRHRIPQPILNPPGLAHQGDTTLDLAIPVPDGADPVLWRGMMRLVRQERDVLAAYFATPNDSDPEARRLLRQLDTLDAALAGNTQAQGLPVHRMPRPMRWEERETRPVFGKKGLAA